MELRSCNKLKEIQLTLKTKQTKEINQWKLHEIAEQQYIKGNPTDV